MVLLAFACLCLAAVGAAASPVAVPSLNYELVRVARTIQLAAPGQELVIVLLGCIHSPSLIKAKHFKEGNLRWACSFLSQCVDTPTGTASTKCPLSQRPANSAVMVILDDASCTNSSCTLEQRDELKQQAIAMGAQAFGILSELEGRQLQLDVMALSSTTQLPAVSSFTQASYHPAGAVFQTIYDRNVWTSEGRGSGTGSSVPYTANIRQYITHTVRKHNIRTILDAPNGGMLWMPLVLDELGSQVVQYTGLDIAHNVVARHQREFRKQHSWEFYCVDVCQQRLLPGYDLIFSRDAMQHLPYSYVFAFLRNVKESGAKWLMIGSYLEDHENRDIFIGGYFRINLLDAPFNCSQPVEIFNEETPDAEKKYALLYDVATLQCADDTGYQYQTPTNPTAAW